MVTTETTETRFVAGPLLTIAEAAKLARVSRQHMWRLVRRGDVDAVRVGNETGPFRIETEAFLGWLYGSQLPEERPPVTLADLGPWVETEVVFRDA